MNIKATVERVYGGVEAWVPCRLVIRILIGQ